MRLQVLAVVGTAACVLLAGCAGSPVALSGMTPAELQAVDSRQLCNAYASYRGSYQSFPNIDAEVKRRGLSCAAELEYYVSDCRQLQLVGTRPDPTYQNVTHFTHTALLLIRGRLQSARRSGASPVRLRRHTD